jgi:hypothetical protein
VTPEIVEGKTRKRGEIEEKEEITRTRFEERET